VSEVIWQKAASPSCIVPILYNGRHIPPQKCPLK